MKQILLKSLFLRNFKGIKDLKIEFSGKETNIRGDNGTGKTTVFDAFTWLLFGKDSEDRKDFEVKTLDKNNQVIHQLEHEVEGELEINGQPSKLKRMYREKWTKRRGESEAEMTGHETLYYMNDVPLSQAEYKSKIDAIIGEELFKCVSSPGYFNTLKWETRRALLEKMAGQIKDEEIEAGKYIQLLNAINGKGVLEYKKEIATKRKKLVDDLKLIPSRIDECTRLLPTSAPNFDLINSEILRLRETISETDEAMSDESARYQQLTKSITDKRARQTELHKLMADIISNNRRFADECNRQHKTLLMECEGEINKLAKECSMLEKTIDQLSADMKRKGLLLQALKNNFKEESEKTLVFADDQFVCPTCKREIEDVEGKKVEMTENFNLNKAAKLGDINSQGKTAKQEIENITTEFETSKDKLAHLQGELSKAKDRLKELQLIPESKPADHTTIQEYISMKTEYDAIEAEMSQTPKLDLSKFAESKKALQTELEAKIKELSIEETIKTTNARIEELKADEKRLAQLIADLEKIEFEIAGYEKAKINMVEERVNKLFRVVRFKMFDTQINGGETPTCVALINGVPYSDANNAARINAGLDIINAISSYNKVSAPVFLDNRESVCQIIETGAQIINLIVDKLCKELTIN